MHHVNHVGPSVTCCSAVGNGNSFRAQPWHVNQINQVTPSALMEDYGALTVYNYKMKHTGRIWNETHVVRRLKHVEFETCHLRIIRMTEQTRSAGTSDLSLADVAQKAAHPGQVYTAI